MLEEGATFPEAALAQLELSTPRSIVFFLSSDKDFNCAKGLIGYAERAAEFAERGCAIYAVRPAAGADAATEARFPALRFLCDEDDAMREGAGLALEARGFLSGGRPHATFIVDEAGAVLATVSSGMQPIVRRRRLEP